MSTSITPKDLQEKLADTEKVCVIDVRRKADYEQSTESIEGATWHDPEKVEEWSKTLPKDQKIVFYCVKGGQVSQEIAGAIEKEHPGACYLEGGIVGWQEDQKK